MTNSRIATMITPRKQQGVVLFIALIVLIAMSLAGVALWRSIGTGVLIAGNIAMQRGAVTSSDAGIEGARAWLMAASPTVLNTTQSQGYISNWDERFDASTFDWDTLGTPGPATDSAGFATRYIVHRMCKLPNVGTNAPSQQCLTVSVSGGSSSRSGGTYGVTPLSGTTYIYYRITSRAVGPRNTVSYTQSIMY
jgi:Tfp pilus assembly protein PilX